MTAIIYANRLALYGNKEDMQAEMRKLNSMFSIILQQNSQDKAGGQGRPTGNQ